MRGGATMSKVLVVGFAAVTTVLSVAGCGQVNQAVCDDVTLLEQQLDSVAGQLTPEVEQEVRDDYAEIATEANCPGYNSSD